MSVETPLHTIIHIGYPKTASTVLQKGLFPNLRNTTFLGKPAVYQGVDELLHMIRYTDSATFQTSECIDLLQRALTDASPLENQIMVSEEGFLTAYTADRGVVAERLRSVFGPAKIIVVIRSQYTIIPSMYAQHYAAEVRFKNFLERHLNNKLNGVFFNTRYHDIISKYAQTFGRNNIKIMIYEKLLNSPHEYYLELCEFLGETLDDGLFEKSNIRSHERMTTGALALQRSVKSYERIRENLAPWLKPSKIFPFFDFQVVQSLMMRRGAPHTPVLTNEWREIIHDFFKDNNKLLMSEYMLNLDEYEYPV